MDVFYNSTRNQGIRVKASEAILKGLSEDGGLFVPDHIPALDKSLKELSKIMSDCPIVLIGKYGEMEPSPQWRGWGPFSLHYRQGN